MTTATYETHRGGFEVVYPDGSRLHMERDVARFDDWRDTPIGRVNYGQVVLGPWRYVRVPAPRPTRRPSLLRRLLRRNWPT